MRGRVELGACGFEFGAAGHWPHVNFLELGAKVGNHAEVAVEWSDEFGMSGAKLRGAWKDHVHLGTTRESWRMVSTLKKLEAEQFSVELIPGTQEAQRYISERVCDLALLGLALPCAVGVEVLRNIRTRKPELLLVFLTASANVEERARCLDAGAHDLIPKPFAFAELAARIRAVLRRVANAMSARLQVDDLVMDRLGHSVQRSDTMTNVVDVYINYLRRKVDSGYDRQLICSVRGTGYQIGTNGYGSFGRPPKAKAPRNFQGAFEFFGKYTGLAGLLRSIRIEHHQR